MHATATPGDATEIENSLEMLHPDVLFTARKGTFGHGMSVGGGWELTAQHLGMAKGHLYGIPLTEGELHADVRLHGPKFVQTDGTHVTRGYGGKLSMGIGGIHSRVVSRARGEEGSRGTLYKPTPHPAPPAPPPPRGGGRGGRG